MLASHFATTLRRGHVPLRDGGASVDPPVSPYLTELSTAVDTAVGRIRRLTTTDRTLV